MDFLELAQKRVSTREFSDKRIEKEDLEKILKACDIAPTGKNRRPIFYVILSSEEKKERLFKLLPSIQAKFYNADALLFSFVKQEDHLKELDCGAAIENALLEATSLDIGSCWIHCASAEMNTEEGKKALKEVLDLDNEYEVLDCIAFGYPKNGRFAVKERSGNGSKIV